MRKIALSLKRAGGRLAWILLVGLTGCGFVGYELGPAEQGADAALPMVEPSMNASGGADTGTGSTVVSGGASAAGGTSTPLDGGMEPLSSCTLGSTTDCGACGQSCQDVSLPQVAESACGGETCVVGRCVDGFADCDGFGDNGCEVDLRSQPDHCGACGVACAGANATMGCAAGACVVALCADGFADCDGDPSNGCERSTRTLTDCGGCGVPCVAAQGEVDCSSGACALVGCMAGYGDCDGDPLGSGCETPLSTLTDCGACGAVCSVSQGTASCGGGRCSSAACQAGFADCDGDSLSCETDLSTLANCGACGVPCGAGGRLPSGSAACVVGSCVVGSCDAQMADCDGIGSNGCETALTQLAHCGGCGLTCAAARASTSCASGTCQISACQAGYADCNGALGDGCETDLNSVQHCGGCDVACGDSEQCVEGACLGFPYTPVNLPTTAVDPSQSTAVARYNCGETRFNSDSLSLSNTCGSPAPRITVVPQTGADLVVLSYRELVLEAGATLRLSGSRPVALAAVASITIAGTVEAGAQGTTAGPGGGDSCGGASGGNGSGSSLLGGGGGGGGGFGTAGGGGGSSGLLGGNQGSAGGARGSAALSPLLGGCGGGYGGGCGSGQARGAAGGAVQLSAADTLRVTGVIRTDGSNGGSGCGLAAGGAGGGSGGAILLEAQTLVVSGTLQANGGNGGNGGSTLLGGGGGAGGNASRTAQSGSGNLLNGGGGGGGAAGRIRLVGHTACNLGGSSNSPKASVACP